MPIVSRARPSHRVWPDPTWVRHDADRVAADRHVARGRLDRAVRGYLGLLEQTPRDPALRNRAGDLLVRDGQLARGVEVFLEVARQYRADGWTAKAVAVYRKILRWAPDHPEAYRELVALYRASGREVDAWALVDSGSGP